MSHCEVPFIKRRYINLSRVRMTTGTVWLSYPGATKILFNSQKRGREVNTQ